MKAKSSFLVVKKLMSNMLLKNNSIICIAAFLLLLIGCQKDKPLEQSNEAQETNDELIQQNVTNLKPDSFVQTKADGMFTWQYTGLLCGGGMLRFSGFVYNDATFPKSPVPYGDFHNGGKIIPAGSKSVNYEYYPSGDTLSSATYPNRNLGVKLEDLSGEFVFDTTMSILDIPQVDCPPPPCINSNTCLPISTKQNSDVAFVGVSYNPNSAENPEGEGEEIIRNWAQIEDGEQVCFRNSLFDNIPSGGKVFVRVVRANYKIVIDSDNKLYKLASITNQYDYLEYCP